MNRPRESRGSQPSGVLLVLFVQAKRIKTFPFREFRGFANLDSACCNGGFAQTKLKPFQKEIRGFANLESAHPKQKLRTNPIKSFAASRLFRRPRRHYPCCCRNIFPPYGGVPVGTTHSVCHPSNNNRAEAKLLPCTSNMFDINICSANPSLRRLECFERTFA